MEEARARSKLSIWLIGLLLGPIILMLWLGRGWLAFFYLLAQLILIALALLVVGTGVVAPPAFADFDVMVLLVNALFNIVGIVHGLRIREASSARPWFSRWYVAIVLTFALSWLIPFGIRELLFQPFNIPSGSMIPALTPGDHVFVSKTAYGYSRYSFILGPNFSGRIWGAEPRRGDIVVFKLPRDNQTDYVKRLIGLPGDRIQMRDGIVHLNGEELKLAPVQGVPCLGYDPCNYFRETLPGGNSYVVNDSIANGAADSTPEYIVPDGHYFMLGDNRDNALDSRFADNAPGGGVGFVPYENLVGRVAVIYWNSYGTRIDDRLQGYPGK
ncbi:signal peptidase I [Taklimakanibacter lacteus]|uniref:signal peptidase I n=1 Tax=Taklimakanibacter lacteus TaxID=2268456 RepID=UPI0034D67A13